MPRTFWATKARFRWLATIPGIVELGLAIKKAGNELIAQIGGREVHPINVRVGGFYRVPTKRELAPLRERLPASA